VLTGLAASAAWVWRERQVAVHQRDQAEEQRERAQANLRKAQQAVDDSYTRISESTLLNHPTLEPLRKQLLLSAVRYYEEFVREHGDNPELQAELVAANLRIGNMIYALGAEEDWLGPMQRAVAVMEDLLRKKPDLAALRSLQGGIFRPMATYLATPKPEEALRVAEKGRDAWTELVRQHPTVPGFQNDLACFHLVVGFVQERRNRPAEATAAFRQSCDLARQVVTANPSASHPRVLLVMSLAFLQADQARLGQIREAMEADRQAQEVLRELVVAHPDVPYYQELAAWTWNLLSSGRQKFGDEQEEEALLRVLAAFEKLAREFPTVDRYRNGLLTALGFVGEWCWHAGRRAEATNHYRRYAEWLPRLARDDAAGHDAQAWFLAHCPDPQFRDPRLALQLAKKAVALAPKDGRYWHTLGTAQYRVGNWQEAIQALNQSTRLSAGDSWDYFFLAMAHWQRGDRDQARRFYDQAVTWMNDRKERSKELLRFRQEAEQLLGVEKK